MPASRMAPARTSSPEAMPTAPCQNLRLSRWTWCSRIACTQLSPGPPEYDHAQYQRHNKLNKIRFPLDRYVRKKSPRRVVDDLAFREPRPPHSMLIVNWWAGVFQTPIVSTLSQGGRGPRQAVWLNIPAGFFFAHTGTLERCLLGLGRSSRAEHLRRSSVRISRGQAARRAGRRAIGVEILQTIRGATRKVVKPMKS